MEYQLGLAPRPASKPECPLLLPHSDKYQESGVSPNTNGIQGRMVLSGEGVCFVHSKQDV